MASPGRPLSPHLQIYRPQITWVPSIVHRLTGLLLSLAALLLVYWLLALAAGPEAYARAQSFFGHGLTLALLVAISYTFFYHLCSGIRHLLWDVGWGFELPRAHASGWIAIAASVLLTAGFWWLLLS